MVNWGWIEEGSFQNWARSDIRYGCQSHNLEIGFRQFQGELLVSIELMLGVLVGSNKRKVRNPSQNGRALIFNMAARAPSSNRFPSISGRTIRLIELMYTGGICHAMRCSCSLCLALRTKDQVGGPF